MKNTMYFHCARPALDENGKTITTTTGRLANGAPTHTLGFVRVNKNIVVMGWAVAHEDLDMYSRSEGRRYVDGRVDATLADIANELPAVELEGLGMDLELEDSTMNLLPYRVWSDGFDEYLSSAMNMLFTEDERDSGIEVMFRSVDDVHCSLNIAFSDDGDEDIANEKSDTDATSDYIYSTFVNDEGEVIVHVQNRADFKANGYSDDVNDDMVAILGPVVDDGGFVVISNDQPILCHEELEEIDVVRYLKSSGLSWSQDLEEMVLQG